MTEVRLRLATIDDMEDVFHWRNAPEVRSASFSTAEISWPVHEAWYRRALANPDRRLLIGEMDGAPLGVIRFDLSATETEISIYLAPGCGGKGRGTALLHAATSWATARLPGRHNIVARVRKENVASLRAFEKAGFQESERVLVWKLPDNKPAESP